MRRGLWTIAVLAFALPWAALGADTGRFEDRYWELELLRPGLWLLGLVLALGGAIGLRSALGRNSRAGTCLAAVAIVLSLAAFAGMLPVEDLYSVVVAG